MKTENGQSLDVILDRAALEMMKNCAGRADDGLTAKILNFLIGCADVKIAFRAARAKKARSFIDKCLCPCDGLDVERLAECAESGEVKLFDYLSKTPFSEGAGILKTDGAAFEKWADDSLIDMIGEAKYKFFGFEPIAAYYYARMNEIEMLRLILSAKSSGLPEGVIRERMRKLYV